jgi:hypothetical protein
LQVTPWVTHLKAVTCQFGTKTAIVNRKRRQSPLTAVVIGHHRSKTAKFPKWRGRMKLAYFLYALEINLAMVLPITRSPIFRIELLHTTVFGITALSGYQLTCNELVNF